MFTTINCKNLSNFKILYLAIIEYRCTLFVCFVAIRPKSTAMAMTGRSVHLTAFFLGKPEQAVNQYFVHILSFVTDSNPSSISTKVWDRTGFKLKTPWICSQEKSGLVN